MLRAARRRDTCHTIGRWRLAPRRIRFSSRRKRLGQPAGGSRRTGAHDGHLPCHPPRHSRHPAARAAGDPQPPLVPPRDHVPLARARGDVGLGPQHRAADDAAGPRRLGVRAPVDRRRLRRPLRRPAAHRRRPRRPLRPPPGAHRRSPRLRAERAARRPGDQPDAGDRQPGADGRRGGVHHAGDPVDHHVDLPAPRTQQGHRHLGRASPVPARRSDRS